MTDKKNYSSEDCYHENVPCEDEGEEGYLSYINMLPDDLKEIVNGLCYQKRKDIYKLYMIMRYIVEHEGRCD